MAENRYELRSKQYLTGTGGRGGKVKREGFVVYDRLQRKVAKGTTGADGRPGAYVTRTEADQVRATLEREHQARLKQAAQRKKDRGK